MRTSLQQSGKAMLCGIAAGLLRASGCILALISLGVLLPIMVLAVDLDVQYLGALPGSGSAYDMAVSGDRAYVAAGDAGFRVIDLTNWAKPQLGEYQTRGYATGVAVTGDLFRGFRLDALSPIASDAFRLRLDGPRGVPVRLQRSANLTDWQDWLPVTVGGSPAEMADSSEGAAPRRFYRAVYP